jgi:hypothetical protein
MACCIQMRTSEMVQSFKSGYIQENKETKITFPPSSTTLRFCICFRSFHVEAPAKIAWSECLYLNKNSKPKCKHTWINEVQIENEKQHKIGK